MRSEEVDFSKLQSFSEMEEANSESKPVDEVAEAVTSEPEPIEPEEEVEDGDEPEETEIKGEKVETKKDEAPTPPWGKPNKVPKGVQDRFKELTSEIKELKSKLEAKDKPANEKPAFDLSDPVQLAQFIASETERTLTERDNHKRQMEEYDRLNKTWTSNYEKAQAVLPDYDTVLKQSTAVLPNETIRYMVESDVGPYVTYTIAKDPNLQALINTLPPTARHEKVLEVEKTVRAYLNGAKPAPKTESKEGVQPPAVKPALKAPFSTVKKGESKVQLDPANCDPMDWILNK